MVSTTLSTLSSPCHSQGVAAGEGPLKLRQKRAIESVECTIGVLRRKIEECEQELHPSRHRAWSVKWILVHANSLLDRGGVLGRLVRLVAHFCAGCSTTFKRNWEEQEELKRQRRSLLCKLKALRRKLPEAKGQVDSARPKLPGSRLEGLAEELQKLILSFLPLKDQSSLFCSSRSLDPLAPVVDHLIVSFDQLLEIAKTFEMTRLLSVWVRDRPFDVSLCVEKIRLNFPRVRYLCISRELGKSPDIARLRSRDQGRIRWDLINDQESKQMTGEGLRVTQLVLESLDSTFRGTLNAIAGRCPQLLSVTDTLHWCFNSLPLSDEDLLALAEHGEKLKELHLRDLPFAHRLPGLASVMRQCKTISTLSLRYCTLDATLHALEQGGDQLSNLELIGPGKKEEEEIPAEVIVRRCRRQRQLNRFYLSSHVHKVGDPELQAIAECWPQLQQLYLACPSRQGTLPENLPANFPEDLLEHLREELPKALTHRGLEALAEGCRQLKALQIRGVKDEILLALSTPFSQLTWLRIGGRISDVGLKAITQSCPQLSGLHLASVSSISDEGVKTLAQGCRRLTYLALIPSQQVSDEGLKSLAEGCPQLTTLNLEKCTQIGDRGVEALAHNCPQLRSLSLAGAQITDIALSILVDHRIPLSTLSLEDISRVTDAGLHSLKGFPNITSLTLSSSTIHIEPKILYSWLPHLNRLKLSCGRTYFCSF